MEKEDRNKRDSDMGKPPQTNTDTQKTPQSRWRRFCPKANMTKTIMPLDTAMKIPERAKREIGIKLFYH
ncbi:MAG: hypothetical protein HYT29_01725 [Parcubacteria group bacterium]|nr:hypothetical protein [Parcubacteria group bacterium]